MGSHRDHHTNRDPRSASYPGAEDYNGGRNDGDHRKLPDDQLPNRSYRNSAINVSIRRNTLVHHASLLPILLFMVRRLRHRLLWSVALRLQLLATV